MYLLLSENFLFCSISSEVEANKNTQLPWSPYQMVLRMNDTSLQPEHGPNYVSSFFVWTVTEKRTVPVPPYSKLDVNIDLRVSAALHSTKMALVSTVEQD
jgi:hypothetical protein